MTTIVSKIALMYFVMLQIGVYVSLIVGIILLGVFLIVRGTKVILKDETINSKAKQRCSMTCTVSGIILGLAPVQSYPNEYIRIASIIISVLLIALLVRLNFRYKESVKVFSLQKWLQYLLLDIQKEELSAVKSQEKCPDRQSVCPTS